MARKSLTAQPPAAHISILAVYRARRGRQVSLTSASMRDSFTGLQYLSEYMLGGREVLAGHEQDFTIMRVGPSAFELEVRALTPPGNRLRGPSLLSERSRVSGLLNQLTDALIIMGQAACCLANNPDATLRFIQGHYGEYFEVVRDGRVVGTVSDRLLKFLVDPAAADMLRALMAGLAQPHVAYATLTKRSAGLPVLSRTVVHVTDSMRSFVAGAELPFTEQHLAAARSNPVVETAPEAGAGPDGAGSLEL